MLNIYLQYRYNDQKIISSVRTTGLDHARKGLALEQTREKLSLPCRWDKTVALDDLVCAIDLTANLEKVLVALSPRHQTSLLK